jgi:hypothetical protein
MYNHEKRLASAKCEPLTNDLAGALINPENTGSVTGYQALSTESVIGILDLVQRCPPQATLTRIRRRHHALSGRPPAYAIAAIRLVARDLGHTERTRS